MVGKPINRVASWFAQKLLSEKTQISNEKQREYATSIFIVHFSGITTVLLLVWLLSISIEVPFTLATYGHVINIYAALVLANILSANLLDDLFLLDELSEVTVPHHIRSQANDILLGGLFLFLGSFLQLLFSVPPIESVLRLTYTEQAFLFFIISPITIAGIFSISRLVSLFWFYIHLAITVIIPISIGVLIWFFDLPIPISTAYVVEFVLLVSVMFYQKSYVLPFKIFGKAVKLTGMAINNLLPND